MARFFSVTALLLAAVTIGCGSGETTDQNEGATASPAADSANSAPASAIPSPTDIVSLFLDEVRRGGEDSRAQSLLTQRAQSVLSKIGHTVQPLGSPDARFDVTRAEAVPGEENAALVHSLWREPAADGNLQDFQVVWAVERESAGWRISGLAIEITEDQPPQIVDFEDGALMERLLVGDSQPSSRPESAAQVPENSTIAR